MIGFIIIGICAGFLFIYGLSILCCSGDATSPYLYKRVFGIRNKGREEIESECQ